MHRRDNLWYLYVWCACYHTNIMQIHHLESRLYQDITAISTPGCKVEHCKNSLWCNKFFQFIVPPFCDSSKLQFIHISLLEYLPAFYPLCLILLTWICVELHDRNFRPLVWAWKSFHRCFVRLRREWSTTSDLIDVFASFFLLSLSRIFFQSLLLTHCRPNYFFNEGNTTTTSNTNQVCRVIMPTILG